MATKTKISIGPEVKQGLEQITGVKIDKVITLSDILAILALVQKLLKLPEAKPIIKEFIDGIEAHILSSKTKVDDVIGKPVIAILRRVCGIK